MNQIRSDSWDGFINDMLEADKIDEVLGATFGYVSELPNITNVSILRPRKMRLRSKNGKNLRKKEADVTEVLVVEASSSQKIDDIGERVVFGDGITGKAAEEGLTQVVDDITACEHYISCAGRPQTGSEIAVPLFADTERTQLIGVLEAQARNPLSYGSITQLEAVGDKLGRALIGVAKGETDTRTGLINSDNYRRYANLEIQYALRNEYNLSVAELDLDYFKAVNDTLGHLAGDKLLSLFGTTLQEHARKSDLLCRIGGDEFLIIMPETDRDEARQSMLRLVTDIGKEIQYTEPALLEEIGTKCSIPIPISYGIGSLYYAEKCMANESDGASIIHCQESYDRLFEIMNGEADAGLYRMKAVNKVER